MHSVLVCELTLLIKLIQTKTESLIGCESNLNAPVLDASQFLLFSQPMDYHTLEVTPYVQFIFPVIKNWQRGHYEEQLEDQKNANVKSITAGLYDKCKWLDKSSM